MFGKSPMSVSQPSIGQCIPLTVALAIHACCVAQETTFHFSFGTQDELIRVASLAEIIVRTAVSFFLVNWNEHMSIFRVGDSPDVNGAVILCLSVEGRQVV